MQKLEVQKTKHLGCKTDLIKLNRYCRKLKVKLQWIDIKATVIIGEAPCNPTSLRKALLNHHIKYLKVHAEALSLQIAFLKRQNIDEKYHKQFIIIGNLMINY